MARHTPSLRAGLTRQIASVRAEPALAHDTIARVRAEPGPCARRGTLHSARNFACKAGLPFATMAARAHAGMNTGARCLEGLFTYASCTQGMGGHCDGRSPRASAPHVRRAESVRRTSTQRSSTFALLGNVPIAPFQHPIRQSHLPEPIALPPIEGRNRRQVCSAAADHSDCWTPCFHPRWSGPAEVGLGSPEHDQKRFPHHALLPHHLDLDFLCFHGSSHHK